MAKYIFFIFIFLLAALPQKTSSEERITVYIKAEGFKNNKGFCYMLLFMNQKGFPESSSHAEIRRRKSITDKTAEFKINIIPGKYAVSIFHDENLNNRLDKTWYGKPVEGIGVSNNPAFGAGPPDFKESAVFLKDNKSTLKIIMNYL